MYTREYLEALPTLAVGQAEDLKIDKPTKRVWLSRCGPEDYPPGKFPGWISIERLIDGRWETIGTY